MPNFTIKKTHLWTACEIARMHNDDLNYFQDTSPYFPVQPMYPSYAPVYSFIKVDPWKDIEGNEHDHVVFDNEYACKKYGTTIFRGGE